VSLPEAHQLVLDAIERQAEPLNEAQVYFVSRLGLEESVDGDDVARLEGLLAGTTGPGPHPDHREFALELRGALQTWHGRVGEGE
jgi:hypothetical protein